MFEDWFVCCWYRSSQKLPKVLEADWMSRSKVLGSRYPVELLASRNGSLEDLKVKEGSGRAVFVEKV